MRNLFLSLAILVAVLPASVRAEMHGGIEIGGKGVKATVVDMTKGPAGPEVKVLLSDSRSTAVTAGLATKGRFDDTALKATADAVAQFAGILRRDHKLPAARIHVVGSSGLFSALEGKPEAIKLNRQLLADTIRTACELQMDFIDEEMESRLSIAGIIPPDRAGDAILLDVGGGNTKGGCRVGKDYVTFSVPFGSVTFADAAAKQKGDTLAQRLAAAREMLLLPALRKDLEGKPELRKREVVYLSGGAAWALATLVHPAEQGAFVTLTAADVRTLHSMIANARTDFPMPDLSTIKDEKLRLLAEKELAKVKESYRAEQLRAGAEVLLGLSEEFRLEKAKQVIFVRHAQIGWLLAYIAEKTDDRRP